ncbi:cuticle protein 18.7-like [Tribolium madens]|uniref:cuticle protein 18.7-like n=1 Tax=Tribolium madens TaxID=41895 RepID=UPI001CF7616E|nr:cuticle protein 18.7-like [Tribolium madens]
MKVLILVSCVLAAATAQYHPLIYPQHIPVLDHNGVPVEPAANQLARAAHYAAHAEAQARTGHYPIYAASGPIDTPEVAAARAQHFADYAVAAQRNGVIVDTPEVQLAKAAHFAAHAAARSGLHLRKRRALYHYGVPVNTPEVQAATAAHLAAHAAVRGVPLDTPEVQAAKAQHFQAHAEALHRTGVVGVAPFYYGGFYPHAVIGHDGQPVETPEVQLAKAAHFAAHAAARHY